MLGKIGNGSPPNFLVGLISMIFIRGSLSASRFHHKGEVRNPVPDEDIRELRLFFAVYLSMEDEPIFMKNQSSTLQSSALHGSSPATIIAGLLSVFLGCLALQSSYAGNATWNLNPTSSDWNTAANWTPATIPNSSSDVATFGVSNTTSITLTEFDSITANVVFNPGASAFTITAGADVNLTFGSVGVTNNSGITQNFAAGPGGSAVSEVVFTETATAGSGTVFTAYGDTSPVTSNAIIFLGGDAGTATLHATGGVSGGQGGEIIFFDGALGGGTADNASVIIDGAVGNNFQAGAHARFDSQATPPATAGNATLTINGAPNAGGSGGMLEFGSFPTSQPTAGNATLIANTGIGGGPGGVVLLKQNSTGGTARIELFGNGQLDVTKHVAPGVTIGSIEGSGAVVLGANNLTVGGNNLSTAFSGVIQDGAHGSGGSLTKTGKGKLTLSKASTYTGGTTVSKGTLLVTNKTGSATGTGAVSVMAGTLGGTGKITGAVTIASGTTPAIVAPGNGSKPGTLTTLSTIAFNAHATYKIDLNSTTVTADKVAANGVTIVSGALVSIDDLGSFALTAGTVFTLINNSAATPIAGTFSNLADGSTLVVGSNTYLVSYEGGDGNDLTLTVVP